MTPWYVWLVWHYAPEVGVGETGPIRIVGVFSSRKEALAASNTGDALTVLTLDESVIGSPQLPVEWIE